MSRYVAETIPFEKDGKQYRVLIEQDECPDNPRTMSGDSPMGLFAIPRESRCSQYCDKEWDYVVDHWLLMPTDPADPFHTIPLFHGDPAEGEEPSVKAIAIWRLGKGEHGPGTTHFYIGGVNPFLGHFDSGQVGWVFATAEAWKTWQGRDWVESVENLETLEAIVEGELEEYSNYLQGNCWEYRVEKLLPECEHGHSEEWVDAEEFSDVRSGGFIGSYPDYGGCVANAFEEIGLPCPEQYKEKEAKAA